MARAALLPLWIGLRGRTQNQATDEIAGVHFVSDFSPKAGIQMRLCGGDRAVMRLPPTMRLLTILNYPTSSMRKVSCAEASAWSSVHKSTPSISCRLNSMGGSEAGSHDEIMKCTWFAYSDPSSS
jgi:hypothetical protein